MFLRILNCPVGRGGEESGPVILFAEDSPVQVDRHVGVNDSGSDKPMNARFVRAWSAFCIKLRLAASLSRLGREKEQFRSPRSC
jgi:hypothetical protein